MKHKVLLFACIEKNIGDDLFIKILCDRYPDSTFVISAKAEYGSLKKIPNLTFSKTLSHWQTFTEIGKNNRFYRMLGRIAEFFLELKLGRFEAAVYIVGNAFKNLSYQGWGQSYYLRARMRLAEKFYFLSTNFGPYNDERWKKDHNIIFSNMEDVCFRDRESYELFSDLPNVRCEPDAVFSLGRLPHSENHEKNILISVIDCNICVRFGEPETISKSYENFISLIISYYLKAGYKVTILNSNDIQDNPAAQRIRSRFNPDENIDIVRYDGNLDAIFALYRNADYVIGTRLHSIVLAMLYDIPVIPISYDLKVKNMLNACGFTGKAYDVNKLSELTPQDISEDLKNYNFRVSSELAESAGRQFLKLDDFLKKDNDNL